jgi:hypothetical protein
VAEKWSVAPVWEAAIVPQTFGVDAIPGQLPQAPAFLLRPLAAPIYITLCTLQI